MATSEYWRRGCQGSKGSRGLTAAGGRGGRGWGEQQRPRRLRQGQLGPESPSLLEVPGAPDSGTLGRPSRRWGKAPSRDRRRHLYTDPRAPNSEPGTAGWSGGRDSPLQRNGAAP